MSKESTDSSDSFPCSQCKKVFTLKSNLSRHISTFHKENHSFTCSQCEKTFLRKDSLIRHIKSHQRKKRSRENVNFNINNKCPLCLMEFPSKRNLLHHSRTEHESIISDGSRKEYFECSKCSVRVTNKIDMKRHIYRVHSSDKQDKLVKKVPLLRCAECGKDFPLRKTIMDHYKEEHKIELKVKQLMFDTIDDFEKWKSPCYAMTNAWVTSMYDVKRFLCHRSGYYQDKCKITNSKRQRHLKTTGSKKIQARCPSEITLRRRHHGGSCFVTHQKTHVGHLIDDLDELKYIYLKEDEKKNIVRLLKAGIPKETILRNMYCDYDPNDDKYQQIETLPRLDDGEYCLDQEDLKLVRPKVSKRLGKLRQRHTVAEEYTKKELFTFEFIGTDIWFVGFVRAKSQDVIEMCVVQKVENKECSLQADSCELLCQPCQCCFHEYQCLCRDCSVSQNMCVHVHALCLFLHNHNLVIPNDIIPTSTHSVEVKYDGSEELVASVKPPQSPSKPQPNADSNLLKIEFEETVQVALETPLEPTKLASDI